MYLLKSQPYQGSAYRHSYGRGLYSVDGHYVIMGNHYFRDSFLSSVSKCFNCIREEPDCVGNGLHFNMWCWLEGHDNNVDALIDPLITPLYSERAPVSEDYIIREGKRLFNNHY